MHGFSCSCLKYVSGEFSAREGSSKNKQKSGFFILGLKYTLRWVFCRNPVLSWAIRYSVFQPVSSFKSMCDNPFSTFWHLMVKFVYNRCIKAIFRMAIFHFGEINKFWVSSKNFFSIFYYLVITFLNIQKIKNKSPQNWEFPKVNEVRNVIQELYELSLRS